MAKTAPCHFFCPGLPAGCAVGLNPQLFFILQKTSPKKDRKLNGGAKTAQTGIRAKPANTFFFFRTPWLLLTRLKSNQIEIEIEPHVSRTSAALHLHVTRTSVENEPHFPPRMHGCAATPLACRRSRLDKGHVMRAAGRKTPCDGGALECLVKMR